MTGTRYTHVYGVPDIPGGETANDAIDYVLERCLGATGGKHALIEGWRVVQAWAVPDELVETVDIEPITQPLFQRVIR